MTVSQIMELAVRDPEFYARLIANPTETSKAAGLVIGDGEQVRIYEQRQNEMHLFLWRRTNIPQLNEILDQANRSSEFKNQLLENPRKILEEKIGMPFPGSATIRVHDEPNVVPIVIPCEMADGELNDAELEMVAGGTIETFLRNAFGRNATSSTFGGQWSALTNPS